MGSLAEQQRQFTAYMRNPDHATAPADIDKKRLDVYRRLLYNNIEGFLLRGFPILYSIIPARQWHQIVRDFMINHRCHTPYFGQISQEFLLYLQKTRMPQETDPPFMLELAHYEWVEVALDTASDDIGTIQVDRKGDLLEGLPVVSPLAWSLAYSFPVHQIGPSFQPEHASTQPNYFVVYRNRQDKVGFMESNAVTARLLECLQHDTARTGRSVLLELAKEMQREPQTIIDSGLQTLLKLRELDIVLGTTC